MSSMTEFISFIAAGTAPTWSCRPASLSSRSVLDEPRQHVQVRVAVCGPWWAASSRTPLARRSSHDARCVLVDVEVAEEVGCTSTHAVQVVHRARRHHDRSTCARCRVDLRHALALSVSPLSVFSWMASSNSANMVCRKSVVRSCSSSCPAGKARGLVLGGVQRVVEQQVLVERRRTSATNVAYPCVTYAGAGREVRVHRVP